MSTKGSLTRKVRLGILCGEGFEAYHDWFYVVDIGFAPLIMGTPFLMKVNPDVHWHTRKM